MARHLTDDDISNVVEILDDWPSDTKLTWDRLVDAVESELGFRVTRQTLQGKARVKLAFHEVKQIFSGAVREVSAPTPPSLKVASERIARQQRTIERLEKENHQLLEQFHTWLYNADKHNITIEQLSEPLPRKGKR